MRHANKKFATAAAVLSLISGASVADQHQRLGELDYKFLPEASGLGVSTSVDDRLWFINDRGNRAELIALDLERFEFSRVTVEGQRNTDWEDLEAFELDKKSWLAIADVGDNAAMRENVRVYFVPEPNTGDKEVEVAHTLELTFPGGARDVESLAVDPFSSSVYLLSKRDKPPALYRADIPDLTEPGTTKTVLERLGEVTSIPAPTTLEVRLFPRYGKYRNQPTAMTLSPDGSTIALMTYGEAYVAALNTETRDWLQALNAPLCSLNSPLLAQPETIGIDADGAVYITSERKKAPLLRIVPDCDESDDTAHGDR